MINFYDNYLNLILKSNSSTFMILLTQN